MENTDRGELVDIILRNDIHTTPQTDTTIQMYRIGENEALIIIPCTNDGKPLRAHCKIGNKFIKFANPADAEFVSNACKQRLNAQIKEQEKIHHFNKRFR